MKANVTKTIFIFCGLIGFLYTIAIIFEMTDAVRDARDYSDIYGMNKDALHWQFKSFKHLYAYDTAILAGSILNLYFCILNLKSKRRGGYYVAVYTIILIALTIRNYVLYYDSGCDHYPGFDPFLF